MLDAVIKIIKTNKKWLLVFAVLIVISFLLFSFGKVDDFKKIEDFIKIDDWRFVPDQINPESSVQSASFSTLSVSSAPVAARVAGTIGLSVGGAKDVNNFRENIKNDFLPLPTDITYEGLFYDYRFDTGEQQPCQKLFCPSYTSAISKDPFSNKDEYLLSVGLNSGIQQSDFARKKLNLVIVLDISGSMSSSFDRYYYDQFNSQYTGSNVQADPTTDTEDENDWTKTKMEVATESVVALLDHLNPDDRFGMVLFDNTSYIAKPLRTIGNTDIDAIKEHILEITPQGGTNMDAGMREGTRQFEEYIGADSDLYENRIIFLTDAQPNLGDTSEDGLLGMTKLNANNKVHTTFIGIGVDFNTELTEHITKIRGANYYSVHSSSDFKKRMDDNFEYMVTPLVFDLQLTVDAPGFEIREVYGSPEANEATGEIMKVNTLFPSERVDGETRGGLVLLHMKRTGNDDTITLTARYRDRNGIADHSTETIEFTDRPEFYENTGIRKGIALARYTSLLKNWLIDEREITGDSQETIDVRRQPLPVRPVDGSLDSQKDDSRIIEPEDYYLIGIPIIEPIEFELGRWERQSRPLQVSEEYKELFRVFKKYLETEIIAIGDDTMQKEVEVLDLLLAEG